MYSTTFFNPSSSEEGLLERAQQHVESRMQDFTAFLMVKSDIETIYKQIENNDIKKEILEGMHENRLNRTDDINELPDSVLDNVREYLETTFNEYGLCFDYVELGTFGDQDQDYFRYQISWGGPSEEIRFYENGAIEFVFLDWFCGVGFNLNRDETGRAIQQYFEDVEMLNFTQKREETGYFEKLCEIEEAEEVED